MTETKTSIANWLRMAGQALTGRGDQPFLESQMVLAQVVQKPRPWLAAHSELILTDDQVEAADSMLSRALAGEPLPYILGHQEFYGLDFIVSPDVLIPRPETELLVQTALDWLRSHPEHRTVADVGTGSGCIALSIAHQLPDAKVVGLDISGKALEVARKNTERFQLSGRVFLIKSDLLEGFSETVDVVCANLPYIPTAVLKELPVARSEPQQALDGGMDGLRLIERLLVQLADRQCCRSLALLEIEANQGQAALTLASQFFPAALVSVNRDWGGHDRLLTIEMR